jgi:hypothetical protein
MIKEVANFFLKTNNQCGKTSRRDIKTRFKGVENYVENHVENCVENCVENGVENVMENA